MEKVSSFYWKQSFKQQTTKILFAGLTLNDTESNVHFQKNQMIKSITCQQITN